MSGPTEPNADETVLRIPDLGGTQDVTVLEVLVKPGDRVETDTPLATLESDKATMDVPSSAAGVIARVLLKRGDKVSAGSEIATLAGASAGAPAAPSIEETQPRAALRATEPYGGEPYLDTVPMLPLSATAAAPLPKAPAGAPRAATAPPQVASAPRDRYDFDLVVLGAGPGGYTAAFRAADLGLSVALLERGPTLGGVCLNVGCIPSKALLHAARVIEDAQAMSEHGVRFGAPQVDAGRLRDWKDSVVARLTGGLDSLARQRKVTVIHGVARFASPHEFQVEEGSSTRRVSFAQCVIAAGSESVRLPGFPDDPRVIDSTGALELDLPASLLVVGGGIIGLEMATVYAALGVKVSVVELTPGLMPGCDRDLVRPLEKRIASRYERILLGTRVTGVEPLPDGLRVSFEGARAPEPQVYGKVLLAVGRAPNGRRIAAEAAGVHVDERGYIPVDRQMRTNVPHIFAIGDVAGQPMLAHKATHEGKVAAEAAAGLKSFFDARVIPSVAYTDPEVAWVGLTETDAKASGVAYEKASFPWAASGRSLALGRDEGITKLLFDPQSHRVLGGGIVGSNAGDLIAEVALAIEMGADAADLALTIHPHPTLSETVAFAAEAFEGTLTDLYLPKRKGPRRGARRMGPGLTRTLRLLGLLETGRRLELRRRMGEPRALPDVVILGAQKCGTSSLHHYLVQHPQVIAPLRKEVHYFDLNFARGERWYRAHFGRTGEPGLNLDSSPYYLFHPAVPERLHALLPQARLVVLLRDPVRRAYSHYWHERDKGRETLGFEEAIAAEFGRLGTSEAALADGALEASPAHQHFSYLARGRYAEQLERWFAVFPRNRFLVLRFEELAREPLSVLNRTLAFLGLSPADSVSLEARNTRRYPPMAEATLARLREYFEPHERRLERLLGEPSRW